MTAWTLAGLLIRRWYVTLALGAVTLAFTMWPALQPPVYWGKVTVVVLLPAAAGNNSLTEFSPVAVAALAVMDVTKEPPRVLSSRADSTLLGLGEGRATLIQLRNAGGQWAPSASESYIDVEATDDSIEGVQKRIDLAVADIRAALRERQVSLNVPRSDQVQVEQSPPQPLVSLVSPSRSRALAASVLTSVVITAAGVVWIDRLLRRSSLRPAAR